MSSERQIADQESFICKLRATYQLRTSIKYLGIYLQEHLNWKTHIAHVQGKLTKNLGILNQLRNYLNLKMLRQLYYTLIYPYLNYGAMCWGNNYQTNLNKICTKQNKCIRSIFFFLQKNKSPLHHLFTC